MKKLVFGIALFSLCGFVTFNTLTPIRIEAPTASANSSEVNFLKKCAKIAKEVKKGIHHTKKTQEDCQEAADAAGCL